MPRAGMGPATGRSQGVESSSGSQSVIMTGQDQQGLGTRKPAGLIDAISEIQQLWVIESTGQNLPADFLTIKGMIQFTVIGMRSGIWEGLLFALLIPLTLTFTSAMIMHELGLKQDWFFYSILYFVAFSPVAFNTFICCFLGKYYIGNVTRRAANCLMNGRSVALFIKGVMVYSIFYFLGKYLTPDIISTVVHKLHVFGFSDTTKLKIYSILMEIVVRLPQAGMFTFLTSVVASAVPFIVVYAQDYYRQKQIDNAMEALEDA